MNFHYLIRRLVGRATCVKDATTRLESSARILNITGDSQRIRLGPHTVIKGELLTFPHGGHILMGQWCYVGEGTRIWSGACITIGDRVMIAHNVNVFDNMTHPLFPAERHEHFRHICEKGHPAAIDLGDQPIRIEDDAWIAAGASILKGVTIGRGAIVSTGSVVTKDVPPMCVVAGNPAQIICQLTLAEVGSEPSSFSGA